MARFDPYALQESKERRDRRRAARRARIDAREAAWVANYQDNMAKCLGLETYTLPGVRRAAE